jgi:hypothetical protein
MGIYSQLFPQPLRTLLDTAHVVSGLLFDEILLSFWAMCHLEAEILFKDGLDVLGAHFQRHHAREEWASRVIVSIFDLFVNKHIPDIGSLRIAAEEKERKESIKRMTESDNRPHEQVFEHFSTTIITPQFKFHCGVLQDDLTRGRGRRRCEVSEERQKKGRQTNLDMFVFWEREEGAMKQCPGLFIVSLSLLKVLIFHPNLCKTREEQRGGWDKVISKERKRGNLLACFVFLDCGFKHSSRSFDISTCGIQLSQLQVNVFALRRDIRSRKMMG